MESVYNPVAPRLCLVLIYIRGECLHNDAFAHVPAIVYRDAHLLRLYYVIYLLGFLSFCLFCYVYRIEHDDVPMVCFSCRCVMVFLTLVAYMILVSPSSMGSCRNMVF